MSVRCFPATYKDGKTTVYKDRGFSYQREEDLARDGHSIEGSGADSTVRHGDTVAETQIDKDEL